MSHISKIFFNFYRKRIIMLKFLLVHIWETIIGQLLNRLHEVKWSLPELKTMGSTAANNYCCQCFWYIRAGVRFQMLWVGEIIYQCSGKREHCVWSIKCFFASLAPTLPKSLLPWLSVWLSSQGSGLAPRCLSHLTYT